jgi:hypothetical protein
MISLWVIFNKISMINHSCRLLKSLSHHQLKTQVLDSSNILCCRVKLLDFSNFLFNSFTFFVGSNKLAFFQGTLAVILPDEVKTELIEVLPLLNQDIRQLVQDAEPSELSLSRFRASCLDILR